MSLQRGDKIMLGIPCRNYTTIKVMNSVVSLKDYLLKEKGIELAYMTVEKKPVDIAQNLIVEKFLETSLNYLFITSDDHLFYPEDVVKLLDNCGEGAISPLISRKAPPFIPVMFTYDLKMVFDFPENKVFKAVGPLCVFHRSVFERFREKFPSKKFFHMSDNMGEDLWFWKHALKAGVEFKVHSSVSFGHFGIPVYPYFYKFFKPKVMQQVDLREKEGVVYCPKSVKIISALKGKE